MNASTASSIRAFALVLSCALSYHALFLVADSNLTRQLNSPQVVGHVLFLWVPFIVGSMSFAWVTRKTIQSKLRRLICAMLAAGIAVGTSLSAVFLVQVIVWGE